jgi:Transposase DDE domain group 1
VGELLAQRVYGIACGYADANDAARLAADPVHKLLVGRDPAEGADLASQPTLCRFENAPDRKQLYRMGEALAEQVIERHRRRLYGRVRRITVDLDPTDDPTHGAQQGRKSSSLMLDVLVLRRALRRGSPGVGVGEPFFRYAVAWT